MATLTITLRDETLKTEIGDAFAASYSNPNSLTNEQMVQHHVSNFIRDVLNKYREKVAVEDAVAAVVRETTLE